MTHSDITKQSMKNIIMNIRDAVFIVNGSGKITLANRPACRLLKNSENDLIGTPLKQHFNTEDYRSLRPHKVDQSRKDSTMLRNDGKEIPVMVSSKEISNKDGDRMIIAIDQSFSQRADKIIASQQRAIVQTSKLSVLGELTSGIAHEINSPLQILGGRCELMAMKKNRGIRTEEEVDKAFELIASMSERIEKIVRGLQIFSRDQANEPMRLARLHQIIDDTLSLCGDRLAKKGVKVTRPEFIEDPYLNCHSTQISQILINLLNNSADAMQMLADRWIKIYFEIEGPSVLMIVQDAGSGVDDDTLHKVFNPFFTTKAEGKGTGLGLSISKQLAESHGGTLSYELRDGHTTFILKLPTHVEGIKVG
jgi:PAS domain S-box-containing protein